MSVKNERKNHLSRLRLLLPNDFEDIMDTLNEHSIMGVTDANGLLIYVNDKFCEVSQYSESELLGKSHTIIKSNYHSKEFYKKLWDTISSGISWTGIIKNKAKDGSHYWVKTTIKPCFNDECKIDKYVSIRTVITKEIELYKKLKKTESQLEQHNIELHKQIKKSQILEKERLNVVGRLASRVSHDIRNPLHIIRCSIEMLKQNNPNLDKSYYDKIERSMDRITHQVNDVFNHISVECSNMKICSVREIIDISLSKIKIPDHIDIKQKIDDCEVECDPNAMNIVLINLLKNSLVAISEPGTIYIDIRDKLDFVEINVTDSGCGIDDVNIDKIFDILFTTYQKGTGLGLTCCKSIIDAHNGKISVISQKNFGCAFKIILPKKQIAFSDTLMCENAKQTMRRNSNFCKK